ncbi:MAG: 6,7-dimethyl-8-ribityllumazine synthase [Planctomycetaceae bacterium]
MKNETSRDAAGIPGEINGLTGDLPHGRISVIASRYHAELCDPLAQAAVDTLLAAGVPSRNVHIVRVPGAWELPLAVKLAITDLNTIAAIALGVVIRGETSHDEHINRAVSQALMQLALENKKPVGFGLLTCNTLEQAQARAGGDVGNKGIEAAEAILEILRLPA